MRLDLALEPLDARDLGWLGVDERADGADHEPGGDLPLRRGQPPQMVFLIPLASQHLAVQPDPRAHAVAVGAAVDVTP